MSAGYSSSPLYQKLGMKKGALIKLIGEPKNYRQLIGDFFKEVVITKETKNVDLIHWFTNSIAELENRLPSLMTEIKKNGVIWVSWYKRSAKKPTELTENIVRDTALAIGLVDVKVCAVDEEWSGLKLVYRVENR